MTLDEAKDQRSAGAVPHLTEDQFRIRWQCGYWDGPTSGVLLYDGREFWFEMIDENDGASPWYRRFAIVALSEEQLERERHVNEEFRRYVGTHWDYEGNGPREMRPAEMHHQFYDRYLEFCREQKYGDSQVIAWFEQ